jgi:hypothetical protein
MASTKKKPEGSLAKNLKIPKKLGECADLLYQTRGTRLAIERDVEELKGFEQKLKAHLIEKLGPDQAAEGIVGELATVRVLSEIIPVANDWEALAEYIVKNKAVDLLQRRLSNEGVRARWEDDKVIPGVEKLMTKKLSITKR